ncbi:MAG: hypothetical protein AB1806_04590 [Acidobacteriota bacterium]
MTTATLAAISLVLGIQQAPAGPPPASDARLRVFVDCRNTSCYEDYLRDEITFVEYMRDQRDADVQVLVTSATTGSNGREYTLSFIGLGALAGRDQTLRVTTERTDSEDRRRRRLATTLTIGLLTYVAARGLPEGLAVAVDPGETETRAITIEGDPWHHWIFSIRGNAQYDAEESTRELALGLSLSADHITAAWKTTIGGSLDHDREEFDLDEDEPFLSVRVERELDILTVRSLNGHWSAGGRARVVSSTFSNVAFSVSAAPAVEWNFFPYAAYTRRQLRSQYSVGPTYARYNEETLFGKTKETRWQQAALVTYEQREPWGSLETTLEWSNYFPGFSQHRLELDSEVTVRVTRGLSLSFEANVSRNRDQIALPRRNATPEEVLLRIRQLQSDRSVRLEFGVTYQFGSKFTSIVNPRFGR